MITALRNVAVKFMEIWGSFMARNSVQTEKKLGAFDKKV
jgi:hypothetical protein